MRLEERDHVLPERSHPRHAGLLMSLNMLIEFGDAFGYTGADFRSWCGEVGFRSFEVLPLAGPTSAAIAYE